MRPAERSSKTQAPIIRACVASLALVLGACDQTGQGGGQAGGQPTADGGGYGPFGPETPPSNAPPGSNPSQPFQQPAVNGGAETVLSGGGNEIEARFQTSLSNTLDNYAHTIVPNWSRVASVPDVMTSLSQGGEHALQVSLRGDQHYAFLGACDNDCNNVDLVLQNANGAVVDSDELGDDYPAVDITPQVDSVYVVRLQLKNCTNAPCFVAIRLMHE